MVRRRAAARSRRGSPRSAASAIPACRRRPRRAARRGSGSGRGRTAGGRRCRCRACPGASAAVMIARTPGMRRPWRRRAGRSVPRHLGAQHRRVQHARRRSDRRYSACGRAACRGRRAGESSSGGAGVHGVSSAHRLGVRQQRRLDDPFVARATADVAGQRLLDVVARRARDCRQKICQRHHHAGKAHAALHGVVGLERRLHRRAGRRPHASLRRCGCRSRRRKPPASGTTRRAGRRPAPCRRRRNLRGKPSSHRSAQDPRAGRRQAA